MSAWPDDGLTPRWGFLCTIWWGFPDDGLGIPRGGVPVIRFGGVSRMTALGIRWKVGFPVYDLVGFPVFLAVLPVPHFWLSTMLSTYRVKLKVKTQVNRKCDRTTSRAVLRLRYRWVPGARSPCAGMPGGRSAGISPGVAS